MRLPEDSQFAEIGDKLLAADGLLVRLWEYACARRVDTRSTAQEERTTLTELAASSLAPIVSGDIVLLPYLTSTDTVAYMKMSRRQFTVTGGIAAAALASGILDTDELARLNWAAANPHRPDPSIFKYYRTLLSVHKACDFAISPIVRLGSVCHDFNQLERFAKHSPSASRPALRGIQAEYAEYIGWLHQEIGSVRNAIHWTDKAMHVAHTGGANQMVAFATIRSSNIHLWDGNLGDASELAAAASSEQAPPGLASLAAEYEALTRAFLGDGAACESALTLAFDLLCRRDHMQRDTLHWAASHDLNHYDAIRATCYLHLGRLDECLTILESVIPRLGRGDDGVKVFAAAVLALAYARDGQPDMACRQGRYALESPTTASVRSLLRQVGDQLRPWTRQNENVAELRRQLISPTAQQA